MAGTLATLNVRITGDASGFHRELGGVERSAQRSGGILRTAFGTGLGFIGATVAMQGIGMAVRGAGHAIIGFNADMEQSNVAFTTLLGSADAAKSMLEDLRNFAKTTPFEFPEVRDTAVFMKAMGFEAKEVIPLMTDVGNAASALGAGAPGMQAIVRALGQMRGAARVNAQDMNQLVNVGVPAWAILAKAIGKTQAETRELSQAGKISSAVMLQAFSDYSKANYGGLMDKQSKTFKGAMSNIKDVLTQTVAGAFLPFFNVLRDAAVNLGNFLMSPGFQNFAKGAGQAVADAFNSIGDGLRKIGSVVGPVVQALGHVFEVIRSGDDVAQGLKETIGNLGEKVGDFIGKVDFGLIIGRVHEIRGRLYKAAADLFAQMAPAIAQGINFVAAKLPAILTALLQVVIDFGVSMVRQFMELTKSIGKTIADNAPALMEGLSNFLQAGFDWLINTGVPMAAAAIGPLALEFIDWIGEMIPILAAALPPLVGTILDFIARNTPVLAAKLVEWAGALVNWLIVNVVPRIGAALVGLAGVLVSWIGGMVPVLAKGAADMGSAFVTNILNFLLDLPANIVGIFFTVLSKVANFGASMVGAAIKHGPAFVGALLKFWIELPIRLWEVFLAILGKVADFAPRFISGLGDLAVKAGKAFANGLIGLVEGAINGIIRAINAIQIHFEGMDLGPLGKVAAIHWGGFNLGYVSLPRFHTGLYDVGPNPVLGMLDPHEMVLPRDVADAFRAAEHPRGPRPSIAAAGSMDGGSKLVAISATYAPQPLLSTASYEERRIAAAQIFDMIEEERRRRG